MLFDEHIFAYDDQSCWIVHADCFGATLTRFGDSPPGGSDGTGPFEFRTDGTVSLDGLSAVFSGLVQPLSSAATESTLAVTTSRAHGVFLIAPVRT
jgi:hypothetical protein